MDFGMEITCVTDLVCWPMAAVDQLTLRMTFMPIMNEVGTIILRVENLSSNVLITWQSCRAMIFETNFDLKRSQFVDFILGRGWIGWKNDTSKNGTSPVQIVFKFDAPQQFSYMHIHSSNQFTKDIQASVYLLVWCFELEPWCHALSLA